MIRRYIQPVKTILGVTLALCLGTSLFADGANYSTGVPYPVQWSQPQILPNGTVVPAVPTRFQTRDVGVQLQPQVSAGTSPVNQPAKEALALIIAADRGDLKTVKALIAAKADVGATDGNGLTALMAASARGYVEIATLLLDKGADINDANKDGKTALIFAAQTGQLPMVKLLLSRHADPRVMDESGKMAIEYATAGKHAEIVALLKVGPPAK